MNSVYGGENRIETNVTIHNILPMSSVSISLIVINTLAIEYQCIKLNYLQRVLSAYLSFIFLLHVSQIILALAYKKQIYPFGHGLSFVVSLCEFVTLPFVFWVRCGA